MPARKDKPKAQPKRIITAKNVGTTAAVIGILSVTHGYAFYEGMDWQKDDMAPEILRCEGDLNKCETSRINLEHDLAQAEKDKATTASDTALLLTGELLSELKGAPPPEQE